MPAAPNQPVEPSGAPSAVGPPRRLYHIHSTLLLYGFVSLLIAVGAFTGQNNLLFWCFGMAIGMMLASGVLSGYMMMRVSVERQPVPDTQEGHPLRLRYAVTNRSRWLPLYALTIREEPRPPAPAAEREARAELDAEPEAFVASVPARSTVIVEAPCAAVARGRIRLDRFQVITTFPFGIVRKALRYSQPAAAIARPRPIGATPDPFGPAAGRLQAESAAATAPAPGHEFIALREYREGDSPRLIAWKPSARLEASVAGGAAALLVRQTSSSSPGRLHVILDLAERCGPEAAERAIGLAAGAVLRAAERGAMVSLTVPVHGIHTGLRPGRQHAQSLLGQLALLPRTGQGQRRPRAARVRLRADEPCLVVHDGAPDGGIGPGWAVRASGLEGPGQADAAEPSGAAA
ncbi:MAG: DUF58 domain-containing protein [Phycisphaeraceae bacterium]|nr:DUF58 domain-containing protein [Phycisphaeraceae bacterium]